MSQLARLIEFLDRDDVSEVVVATGRPVSVLAAGNYRPVSRAAVTRPQLDALMSGTPVAEMVEAGVGAEPNLRLFDRNVAVEVVPEGIEVCVRFSRATRPRGVSRVVRRVAPVAVAAVEAALGEAPTGEAPAVTAPARADRPAGSEPRSREPSRVVSPAFAALVAAARHRHATDLHVSAGQPAGARVLSAVHPVSQVIDEAAAEQMLLPLLDTAQRARLEERGYVDAALDVEGAGRLRANISRIKGGLKGSFRLPWAGPPTLEQLGLPRELARVTTYHQGLVVIAGPSGHGKTTTLAALVDLINASKPHHILTIEDPVEILHPRKKSVVSQREVGTHTRSFVSALKASLREDPDVIVIGELRDRETVEIALTAAETGHLVMATMSTPSAAKTLDRLIDMFPPDVQQQVRASLAAALKFVVAQRLLPTTGGDGVVAAVELLTGVLPLAAMIRDNKLYQVGSLQQRGRAFGMIRLDDSLAELVRGGRIAEEVAMRHAENRRELAAALRPARRGGG